MKEFKYNFWDQPYVKAAGEGFKGVFLALHPFIKLDDLRPEPCGYNFDFSELDAGSPFYGLEQDPHGWRALESVIKRRGQSIA